MDQNLFKSLNIKKVQTHLMICSETNIIITLMEFYKNKH